MLQTFVHYANHFLVIFFIARLYIPKHVWKSYLVLLATMLIDIDHLWATPIFDPSRCSIGFHTFHSEIAILVYVFTFIFIKNKWVRLICIGLIFHVITDAIDCIWSNFDCFQDYFIY
jgi:hypothetical protein